MVFFHFVASLGCLTFAEQIDECAEFDTRRQFLRAQSEGKVADGNSGEVFWGFFVVKQNISGASQQNSIAALC